MAMKKKATQENHINDKEEEEKMSNKEDREEEEEEEEGDDISMGGKEGGILTAVRVRPRNTKEAGSNSRIISSSAGFLSHGINLLNPVFFKSSNQTEKLRKLEEKSFNFDHTFWSLKGEDSVEEEEYATQEHIYNKIGKPIIDNALSGFNNSLFAYGQTGSGKTHTMMGHNAALGDAASQDSDDDTDDDDNGEKDQGIIPRLCQDLLREVNQLKIHSSEDSNPNTSPDQLPVASEQVIEAFMRAAYYEIYNEKLYDLLSADCEIPRKVREHATEGAYVEGLTYKLIQSYADIESILKEGQERRKTAETKMNAESSRSHAVFVIDIYQKLNIRTLTKKDDAATTQTDISSNNNNKKKSTKVHPPDKEVQFTTQVVERKSKICLIDLAGSERVNSTGATGERLKEATNINSSLSTLGEVIRKLSEKGKRNISGSDKDKNDYSSAVHIPYRNSVLTWILKDSLGGNSKTAIVATISPCEASYAESLNTLRYLERAKYIETNAIINENNSQDPYVKHLQHQLSAYKAKLNAALTKNRHQERDHKTIVSALNEEIAFLKSQGHISISRVDSSGSLLARSNRSNDSLDEDDVVLRKQTSCEDLAVNLGSELDLMQLFSGGEEDDRMSLSRSPSRRSRTPKGRTKEYFENECNDLQDALARSMAECNDLRERLVEVEDLHGIDMEILREQLQQVDHDQRRFGSSDESPSSWLAVQLDSPSKFHEDASSPHAERLQMRIHEKDGELSSERIRYQQLEESSGERIFTLETTLRHQKNTFNEAKRMIDAYKSEVARRDDCLSQAGITLPERRAPVDDSSLLAKLELEAIMEEDDVPDTVPPVFRKEASSSVGGEDGEGNSRQLQAYKDLVTTLEDLLATRSVELEEANIRVSYMENEVKKEQAVRAEASQRLEEKEATLSASEETRQDTEEQLSSTSKRLEIVEAEGVDKDAEVVSLKKKVLDLEKHIEELTADCEKKKFDWGHDLNEIEATVRNLNDEVDVLKVDISTKDTCLELFESQLAKRETEQNALVTKHEETIDAMKVEAEVMGIYLAAKEESLESLEQQIRSKDEELVKMAAEKTLLEDGLTIELESFKLALAGKEESHQELHIKLEDAIARTHHVAALDTEIEELKQGIKEKNDSIAELQEIILIATEETQAAALLFAERIAEKEEAIGRMATVDIPRLKRELVAKDSDFEENVKLHGQDRHRLEEEICRLREELESRKLLDASAPGKKSKFICF